MNAQNIKVAKLVPNTGQIEGLPKNPRLIRDEKFAKLVKSIKDDPEMMELRELLVMPHGKQFVVIAGNMRLRAMMELGYKDAPCKVLDKDTSVEKLKAYTIKDNVGFGEHDWDALANGWDTDQLQDWGMDLPGDFGIDASGGLTSPDEVPDVPANPLTVLGDVWIMGKHRIVCGDSTNAETVAKCLNGVKPHLMVTDPPYGVEYDASWREESGIGEGAHGKVLNDDRADWQPAWDLFPGAVAYVWHAGSFSPTVADSLIASGFVLRNLIVWAKDRLVISRGNYHHQHEPCWYAVRSGQNAQFTEDRTQTTLFKNIDDITRPGELVFIAKDEAKRLYAIRGDKSTLWQIPKPVKSETGHSTQKPVECMKRPIENNSSPGQAVYEPFSGSGTTIIAGEMTGRAIHAIELSPAYVDVAVKRWQDFTGLKAIHEPTGRTFEEVAAMALETTN